MASTSNNSGLNGDPEDKFGPDEKWDDESEMEFHIRMEAKREFEKEQAEIAKTRMPPCIG